MVFVILLITAVVLGALAYLAVQLGLLDIHANAELAFFTPMVFSILVGTFISILIGRITLKPVRQMITAINKLAGGDFSARLTIEKPPEFKELSDSFNSMAKELGGLELLRTDFVNNFSHEFKTPIMSIKGFAEILKRDDLLPEQRNKYLDVVIRESDRLASLATNVLNLSKIENQTILSETNRFNLTEQVRRCILMLESKWEAKDIELSLAADEIYFVGNEELLNQVWLNLIDNAVKFTKNGGSVGIALKQAINQVTFTIWDDGEGISDEAVRHIFDKFYQGDISHASAGTGLGLTLVKKIVELHKGTISCKSEPEAGTEFTVELPQRLDT
jgi:signal transduction histidine kinase